MMGVGTNNRYSLFIQNLKLWTWCDTVSFTWYDDLRHRIYKRERGVEFEWNGLLYPELVHSCVFVD